MTISYDELMNRRKFITNKIGTLLITDPKNKSVKNDLRAQLKEIDAYIQKYHSNRIINI